MMGANIMSNTLNKVSSNSEDTKFFFDYFYCFISNKLLLLISMNNIPYNAISFRDKNITILQQNEYENIMKTFQTLSHHHYILMERIVWI